MLSLINRSRNAPDCNSAVRAALAHHGHPCSHRHLHRLRNIRYCGQQKIPCDRMKRKHPPRIACFSSKQHYKMDAENQYHRKIQREDCGEHIVLIGRDRRKRSLCSDTRPQIGGKPCHGGHPCMDGQGDCNGEYPAQELDGFCFLAFCVNVRIQRFYNKIIEKAPDCSQPNGKHRLPQLIGAGQIIGSVEKTGVRFLKRNAPQQPVPGSHKSASDCSKNAPVDELFRFLRLHLFCLQLQFMILLFIWAISNFLENQMDNTADNCRSRNPDQRQYASLFQHLPPCLHERRIFKPWQHPKLAVPDP